MPFARPGSKFTRDFEALVSWLATTMDQTALARMLRIDWAPSGGSSPGCSVRSWTRADWTTCS
ncbi:MAG TPA: transposase family protein [Kineosporiaceae bacterium]|nr:transposase family protein [Kineosporiaceae bacterium]